MMGLRSNGFSARAFFLLAAPMIVSRAGLAAMGMADAIMVSRFQSREFAWLSLAEGTLGRLLDVFVAFLIGGLSLAPRLFARGDAAGARLVWVRTFPWALGLGLAGLLVGLSGHTLLAMMGQPEQLALGAAPVTAILGAGYPAALLAVSSAVYLEGIQHPQFVAASVVIANVLNISLNWVLIGGHLGFPAMGARGSALSTTIVRCVLGVALVAFASRMRGSGGATATQPHIAERAQSLRVQWRLGYGAAGTVAVMVVLTASLTVFAGWLGVLPLAIFAAAWNLAGPAALVGLGMSDAAGIHVSSEAGRSGEDRAASIAWASLRLTLVPVAALAACLAILAAPLARIYTRDASMWMPMAAVIPMVALILLVDCAGFVMAASLRAIREVAWPAGIDVGTVLFLLPLAATLAFARGYGVRGLLLAMFIAGVARTAMLTGRFRWRTRASVLQVDQAAEQEWTVHAE